MPNGRKVYYIVAFLVVLLVIVPLFGFVFSVLHSVAGALCFGTSR